MSFKFAFSGFSGGSIAEPATAFFFEKESEKRLNRTKKSSLARLLLELKRKGRKIDAGPSRRYTRV